MGKREQQGKISLSPESKESKDNSGKSLRRMLRDFGEFFLYTIIPVVASLFVWYQLAGKFQLWKLSDYVFIFLWVLIVLGLSFFFSIAIAAFVNWCSQVAPSSKQKRPITRGQRLLRIILGGILVPILLSVIANMVPVSGKDTLVTLLIKRIMARTEYPFITKISDTVISADSIDTKCEGVQTLETIHSEMCLDEIFRILEIEKGTLNDEWFYSDMSDALASYESRARIRLLTIFYKYDEQMKGIPRGVGPDLHEKYFEKVFKTLKQQVEEETLDPERKKELLLRLEEIELQLESELRDFEAVEPLADGGEPILDVILDTFLQMQEVKDDPEVYFLARRIAADPSYREGTRRKAILLIAKLGTKEDFAVLLPYLESESESIKSATLRAISNLHLKISGEKVKGEEEE